MAFLILLSVGFCFALIVTLRSDRRIKPFLLVLSHRRTRTRTRKSSGADRKPLRFVASIRISEEVERNTLCPSPPTPLPFFKGRGRECVKGGAEKMAAEKIAAAKIAAEKIAGDGFSDFAQRRILLCLIVTLRSDRRIIPYLLVLSHRRYSYSYSYSYSKSSGRGSEAVKICSIKPDQRRSWSEIRFCPSPPTPLPFSKGARGENA